jgi:Uma2 family endonuclease
MANVPVSPEARTTDALPLLEAGDHLDQKTFHERYEAMPPSFRAELIGGFVVVPSPLSRTHASYHAAVMHWLGEYKAHTPGTAVLDNPTVILGADSEPQPDAALIIEPHCGGQSRVDEQDYVVGPPEFVVEVASSSEAYDLHEKRRDYERAGVREYLVVIVRDQGIRWFYLERDSFQEIPAPADRIYDSKVFPGLRLDAGALLTFDGLRVLETLRHGLASPEHAVFVKQLQTGRSGS